MDVVDLILFLFDAHHRLMAFERRATLDERGTASQSPFGDKKYAGI
jgi:hypothetical protein